MRIFIGILLIFLAVGAGNVSGVEVDVVDLTGDPGHLEFIAEDYVRFSMGTRRNGIYGPNGILFDVDGNGYDDLIRSNDVYVCAVGQKNDTFVTFYQINLPPEFCRKEGHSFSLTGDLDLNGDGKSEVVITGQTEDRLKWGFWTIDPGTGEILGSFELEGGPETRLDGKWDGNYSIAGTVNYSRDGVDHIALVMSVNIGFDLEGRGVLAVDPWTGEILWHYLTGPNPTHHSTRVIDLDGDGDGEIIVFGRAPNNMHGRKVNGYSDDESRLFVLDHQGKLLWTQHLAGYYGGGYMITADLDDDGFREIVTTVYSTPDIWSEVAVWSHDGKSLARYSDNCQFNNVVLFPDAVTQKPRLAAATASGEIQILEFHPPELTLAAEVQTGLHTHINGAADFLPLPGVELAFTTQDRTLWVLGNDLQPLARTGVEQKSWQANMVPWQLDSDLRLMMRHTGPGNPILFTKAPPPPSRIALIVGGGGLVLLLVLGIFYWKKSSTRLKGDPVVLREVRLNLLEDLELSNHGAIAPLKCLRRLIWHLNAMNSGLGDNPSIEIRLRETWTESMENALPHLAGILDRARLAGLAGANVEFAARSLDRIKDQLENLEQEGFQVSGYALVTGELTAETAKADDALKDLRREVAGFFHTDLASTVTRVLRANSQAIEDCEVTVQTGFLAQMAAGGGDGFARSTPTVATCLIDPKEMDFVMDNLVANAVRAMRGAQNRNLSVTWSSADGMVTVDVRDSGCGIPDEHRDRILETNFSTREGGGEGLPRSRKILRKYGGGLMILDTSVGHGTTFRVTLPAAV